MKLVEYLYLTYYLLKPRTIVLRRVSTGMGDNLMLSALVWGVKRIFPNIDIVIETQWPELFRLNPDVVFVTSLHYTTTKRFYKARYAIHPKTVAHIIRQQLSFLPEIQKRFLPMDQSIRSKIEALLSQPVLPRIYLSEEEMSHAKSLLPFPYIVICPSGKQAFSANRKEWDQDHFQTLVNLLLPRAQFVQIGSPHDLLLQGVIDARGLKIRESAAVLANSLFFIGLEGGLMHLNKAVGHNSVIIVGGFIQPGISNYPGDLCIYRQIECSPCFHSDAPHDDCLHKECMATILPQDIYDQIIANWDQLCQSNAS